jgi:hypothetical protein
LGKAIAPALISVLTGVNSSFNQQNRHTMLSGMSEPERIAYLRKGALSEIRAKGYLGGDYVAKNYSGENYQDLIREYNRQGFSLKEMKPFLQDLENQAKLNIKSFSSKKTRQAAFMFKYGLSENPFYSNENNSGADGNKNADKTLKDTLDNISGGGGVRNFTVNIGKFQDQTVMNNGSLDDNISGAEQKLYDMFIRVVQGVELAAGGAQ